jgi:5-methylcytosine-specific restriction protein A
MPTRIPSHKPPRLHARSRRDESTRPSAAARGYCDRAHRAWRQAVLTRDAWACRACGRVCSDHREAHADHIVPISQGGSRYDVANGQTLCASCHSRKTRAEQQDARHAASAVVDPGAAGRLKIEQGEGGPDHANAHSYKPSCPASRAFAGHSLSQSGTGLRLHLRQPAHK